jgi:hypothetical protein
MGTSIEWMEWNDCNQFLKPKTATKKRRWCDDFDFDFWFWFWFWLILHSSFSFTYACSVKRSVPGWWCDLKYNFLSRHRWCGRKQVWLVLFFFCLLLWCAVVMVVRDVDDVKIFESCINNWISSQRSKKR